MNKRSFRRPAVVATAAVALLALGMGGTAVADGLIKGNDIAKDAIKSRHLADGAVKSQHINGSAINSIQDGVLASGNWGEMLRQTLGSASAELREGPHTANFGSDVSPPMGTGSLQIDTADGASKVDFGNEVDFVGKNLVDTLDGRIGFSVYTTGENAGRSATNLPAIRIEVDPNRVDGENYSSLVFVPDVAGVNGGWKKYDATTDGTWFATFGGAPGCTQASPCDFDTLIAALPDATIHSVAVGKGRDTQFHGAVDALRIGGTVFDFEARGVFADNG